MSTYGSIEPDDGRWSFVRGVGTVRSGPRGLRHWDRGVQQRQSVSLSDPLTESGNNSSESDHCVAPRAARSPGRQSTGSGNFGDDEAHPIKIEEDSDLDLSVQGNYMDTLSNIFGDHHRDQGSSNTPRSSTIHNDRGWRDDRRDTTGFNRHLRKRVRREDTEDRQDSATFLSTSSVTQSTERSASVFSAYMGDRRRHSSSERLSPSPPPPPPIYRAPRPPRGCKCPIGFLCQARHDILSDCRTLTAYFKKWPRSATEINVDELLPMTPCPLATFGQLNEGVKLLNEVDNSPRRMVRYQHIGDWLNMMRQTDVSEELLTQTQVVDRLESFLDEDHAQARAVKRVPINIVEDLTFFYRKWRRGDLSMAASRGLCRGPGGGIIVDPEWPHKRAANVYGDNGLVNGQTWNSRIQMMRDGAHAMPVHGVYGNLKDGAYAIVMGWDEHGNEYADVDAAEMIWYNGTALPAEPGDPPSNVKDTDEERVLYADVVPTLSTRILLASCREGAPPVRLFRSAKASHKCIGKPDKGYRYDGLYIMKGYLCLKAKRAIYHFELHRSDAHAQGPLRGFPPRAQRPEDMLRAMQPGAGDTRHL